MTMKIMGQKLLHSVELSNLSKRCFTLLIDTVSLALIQTAGNHLQCGHQARLQIQNFTVRRKFGADSALQLLHYSLPLVLQTA